VTTSNPLVPLSPPAVISQSPAVTQPIDPPVAKDGDVSRRFFSYIGMKGQLQWALFLIRQAQQYAYRGIQPRGMGRRAAARAAGYSNHQAYLRAQQEKLKATDTALAVNRAFN